MENVQSLHWQLSVLSRAIHYKNLSSAASHVGLSQPQLSRIIGRLESELGVILLDRTARRKSGWTPIAFKIADTYFQSSRKLTQSLQQLKDDQHIQQLTVATLEGLIPLANQFCRLLFEEVKMKFVELNVVDLGDLEERFEKDEFDLIFTCREPSKQKYTYVRTLGYQTVDKVGSTDGIKVFSAFDYANYMHQTHSRRFNPRDEKVFISNSLSVRKIWVHEFEGQGIIPSDVRRRKQTEKDMPVLLMANNMFNSTLWEKLLQFKL